MSMTILKDAVERGSSWEYVGKLQKGDGSAIGSSTGGLTLRMTLYALDDDLTEIIAWANILNTGRGTLDLEGNLSIAFSPADNPVLDDALDLERHEFQIEAKWQSNTKGIVHRVRFEVENMPQAA